MPETFHAGPNLGQLSDVTVIHGDCIEAMRELPDNSIDAIVTDPPYGLGFMGKEWDALPPGLPWAQECLRVLKPGGHLLAFGGTRTWHRLAVAVEDAGFEIRDSIAWLYGSGFPKSLDVGKAIDKAAGVTREVVGEGAAFGSGSLRNRSRVEQGYRPTELNPGGGAATITAPATPEAEQWQGWGTALKPAHEPVVVGRKPFKGNVAANVLTHGTGALNIDGCRIGTASGLQRPERRGKGQTGGWANYSQEPGQYGTPDGTGRWPANVVLDGRTEPVLRLRYNLPVEVERTIRESFGASTGHLPAVRDFDCCATEPRGASEVLLAPVPSSVDVGEPDGRASAALGQAAHSGDASKDLGNEASQSANGREVPRMEGRTLPEPGLHVRETERAADARAGVVSLDVDSQRRNVYPGAPASDSSPVGSGADAGRARASHQRAEGGQPTGELGVSPVEQLASDEARRGGRGDVQATQGKRGAAVAPLEILHSQCPSGWLQHFTVVGESQSQAAALDEQSGVMRARGNVTPTKRDPATSMFGVGGSPGDIDSGDSGGASRFFYCAKAPKKERPTTEDGTAHPTVKPLALMRWLVRLVTPPGGTCLDPFAGSGTTVEAALLEGFKVVGIEREADYLPMIQQRIARCLTSS